MPGWDALLERLAETPRENGSAGLHETASWIVESLRGSGVEPALVPFTAHPYALRLAGVLTLVGAIFYARLVFSGRFAAALATAVLLPALLLAELDFGIPLFGWPGRESQSHVWARIEAERPEQRLILAAHYDTKTDLLDHLERAPVDRLAVPLIGLLWVGAVAGLLARRFPRRGRWLRGAARGVAMAGVAYGVASFAALSAGALVPERSPGALDDGAACALLIALADELNDAPLQRTDVELLWLSAEEVGVQGSRIYAGERFAAPPELPTWVLNLEGLGATARHAVLGRERFTLRSYAPAPELVTRLDAVHRRELAVPLGLTTFGGATDARSFLARGVPAATLVGLEPGGGATRGLHSAADSRSRIDPQALEASLRLLRAFVRDVDAQPLR